VEGHFKFFTGDVALSDAEDVLLMCNILPISTGADDLRESLDLIAWGDEHRFVLENWEELPDAIKLHMATLLRYQPSHLQAPDFLHSGCTYSITQQFTSRVQAPTTQSAWPCLPSTSI
jgi:hypothetical protein